MGVNINSRSTFFGIVTIAISLTKVSRIGLSEINFIPNALCISKLKTELLFPFRHNVCHLTGGPVLFFPHPLFFLVLCSDFSFFSDSFRALVFLNSILSLTQSKRWTLLVSWSRVQLTMSQLCLFFIEPSPTKTYPKWTMVAAHLMIRERKVSYFSLLLECVPRRTFSLCGILK